MRNNFLLRNHVGQKIIHNTSLLSLDNIDPALTNRNANRKEAIETIKKQSTANVNVNVVQAQNFLAPTPLIMHLGDLSIGEILYVLEEILIWAKSQREYVFKMQIPIDGFVVDQIGKISFQSDNLNQKVSVAQEKQIAWVEKFMERMRFLLTDSFKDFYLYYQRNRQRTACDIKYTLSLIKSYKICGKLNFVNQITLKKKQKKRLKTEMMINDSHSPRVKGIESEKKRITNSVKCHKEQIFKSVGRSSNKNKESSANCQSEKLNKKEKQIQKPIFFRQRVTESDKNKSLKKKYSKMKQQFSFNLLPNSHEKKGTKQSLATNVTDSQNDLSKSYLTARNNEDSFLDYLGHKNSQKMMGTMSRALSFLPMNLEQVQSLDQSENASFYLKQFDEEDPQNENYGSNSNVTNNWIKSFDYEVLNNIENLKQSFTDGIEEPVMGLEDYCMEKLHLMARDAKKSMTIDQNEG